MDDPVGDMVVFHQGKYLCFIDIPGICPRVDDAVSIPGIRCPDIVRFSVMPPHGISTDSSERGVQRRKPYHPPRLTVYGSIQKLTSGTTGPKSDGVAMMRACL